MAEDRSYFAVAYLKQKALGVSQCFLNQTNKKNIFLTDPPPQLWQECCRMSTKFFFLRGEHQQLKEA